MGEPELISIEQAAEMMGLSVESVRRRAVAGELPGFRLRARGNPWRFRREDVERLVRRGATVAEYGPAFAGAMRRRYGAMAGEHAQEFIDRLDVLEEAARSLIAEPGMRERFAQLDAEALEREIESAAQEIARRMNDDELARRVSARAAEILGWDQKEVSA